MAAPLYVIIIILLYWKFCHTISAWYIYSDLFNFCMYLLLIIIFIAIILCSEELYYKTNISSSGSPIFWYRHLSLVPKAFTIFLAHEFFDVLPIHKMQRTKEGWREVLIDVDVGDGPHHLRYVLSNSPTPATKIFTEVGLGIYEGKFYTFSFSNTEYAQFYALKFNRLLI